MGWDGSCLLPSLDLSAYDLSPSSCWCFGTAQPWAVCGAAPGGGQEGEETRLLPPCRARDGCAAIAGALLPCGGRPDLADGRCVGEYMVGAGHRFVRRRNLAGRRQGTHQPCPKVEGCVTT